MFWRIYEDELEGKYVVLIWLIIVLDFAGEKWTCSKRVKLDYASLMVTKWCSKYTVNTEKIPHLEIQLGLPHCALDMFCIFHFL
jgi:hypothetical protein